MFIRRALKLSSSLKNVPLASQNVFVYHLSHVEKVKGTGYMQEHTENNINKLESDLKGGSLPKVLITLQNNKDVIQGSHITMAMSTCYYLMKKEASLITGDHTDPTNIEWKEHSFFKEMLEFIKSNIKKLSGPEAVQVLYYTKKLKGTFETHQVLISHIYKNLKDLSLDDFRMIVSLFKHSEKNKYLADLERAMIKNFIMRVSVAHKKNEIDYLANGLYFLSCNSSKSCNKLLNLFVEDLCEYKNNIPLEYVMTIFEALCSLNYFPKKWPELYKKVQENIIDNIDAVHSAQISYIIFAVRHQIKPIYGRQEFYDATFIDKLIQKLIYEDPGFETALSIVRSLIDMRHYNMEILNYVCASYFEKKTMRNEHITNLNAKLSVLMSGLAHANYKSIFWNEVENYIMTEKSLLEYNHETLCILALNALCLDCYPIEILKKLFDDTYDFSKATFLHWTFSKVCQVIETNHLYEGPRPTESQIQSLKAMFEKFIRVRATFPLLPYLEKVMGGQTYVKTNLGTKLFHVADHVVAYDKNDLPIPLNSETKTSKKSQDIEYIEDLKVPQGSKIVAVIFAPSTWYLRNTKKLIGPYKVLITTLGKIGYNVVDIDSTTWKEIPNKEKISFLQSAITSKLKTPIITT